jgi:hypothetical protein
VLNLAKSNEGRILRPRENYGLRNELLSTGMNASRTGESHTRLGHLFC